MILQKIKNNKGFVILFAVTLSAILLSIALGVATIAEKEIKFGTSARDTTNAFAAADTGIECALFHDRSGSPFFTATGGNLSCGGVSITPIPAGTPANFWTFAVTGLGSSLESCAKVTVDKTAPPITVVTSKGYNVGNSGCDSNNPNRIERELEVAYSSGVSAVPQSITWTNAVGVCTGSLCTPALGSNGVKKTAAAGYGNAGASSVQSIASGDGYVEFSTGENDRGRIAGWSNGDSNQDYTDIDYGLHPRANGTVEIYEKGVQVAVPGVTYAAGDIFRVVIASGVVRYYKNSTLLHTSSAAPVYPLLFDTALNQTGATIINAVMYDAP